MATTTQERSFTAADWKARSDRGPHQATLPSGSVVSIIVPDSNALIRSGRLPERLNEIAVMAAAYQDGAEGYVSDLAFRVVAGTDDEAKGKASAKLAEALKDGLELRDWLVSHMVVSPAIRPEDVTDLPDQDVEMLLEFAERKRNTDASGVKLPIMVLEEFARFRGGRDGAAGAASRESDRGDVPVADDGIDGAAV